MMFDKILIANRGEIACRIIKTCQRLGVHTVAVYSHADHRAKHVFLADEAFCIGESAAKESYLNIDALINVAKKANAKAIHPGYGFLSENAAFAQACADAGLVFIGAPVHAIKAMGDKAAAKKMMIEAGVPVIPGYNGDSQSLDVFIKEAEKIGYPILLKASAGGGGKGMRIVENEKEFSDLFHAAKREALVSFKDDRLILEKYIACPRHIEVQVFADSDGNVVHLFERDCSIQRRHQKIIEEAPAPGITPDFRTQLGKVACDAARAIQYLGAGTVEFIVTEDREFYFMEMNTRLQVEHPVTEMITGQDLVEWQIEVAQNHPLPLLQDEIELHGHAIEARLYAEDPHQHFLPATGKILFLSEPKNSSHVRIESGIRVQDEVSVYYDPLLTKIVAWGATRAGALQELRHALDDYLLLGPTTNRDFLREITRQSDFMVGIVDTQFVAKNQDELLNKCKIVPHYIFVYSALYLALIDQKNQPSLEPWHTVDSFQLNLPRQRVFHFKAGEQHFSVTLHYEKKLRLQIQGIDFVGHGSIAPDGRLVATLNDERHILPIFLEEEKIYICDSGEIYNIERVLPSFEKAHEPEHEKGLVAPMPGTITQIFVKAKETVQKGDKLLILEAMKMEHTVFAQEAGTIESVLYKVGDIVEAGALLFDWHK